MGSASRLAVFYAAAALALPGEDAASRDVS